MVVWFYMQPSFCLLCLIVCVLKRLVCFGGVLVLIGDMMKDRGGGMMFKCAFMAILTIGVTLGVTVRGYIFEK